MSARDELLQLLASWVAKQEIEKPAPDWGFLEALQMVGADFERAMASLHTVAVVL